MYNKFHSNVFTLLLIGAENEMRILSYPKIDYHIWQLANISLPPTVPIPRPTKVQRILHIITEGKISLSSCSIINLPPNSLSLVLFSSVLHRRTHACAQLVHQQRPKRPRTQHLLQRLAVQKDDLSAQHQPLFKEVFDGAKGAPSHVQTLLVF